MPSTTPERPRRQHGRPPQLGGRRADEPRRLDVRGADVATPRRDPHPGYDAELNPIDDEFINTHGSER